MSLARPVLYIMPASRHRYDLLRKRLDLFTRMLPGVAEGDARALHRTRVATRRLRELLPILQLDNDLARKLGRRLRRMTTRLGSVRELDVLILFLDELHESGRYHEGGVSRSTTAVAHERDERRKRLDTKLPGTELRRIARGRSRRPPSLPPGPSASSRRWSTCWRPTAGGCTRATSVSARRSARCVPACSPGCRRRRPPAVPRRVARRADHARYLRAVS